MKISIISALFAACIAVLPLSHAWAASTPAIISIDTRKTLDLPTRSNFSGANMQVFYTGTSYLDPKMQQLVQTLDLGWIRFPGGTVDDVYDWKTGDMRDDWISQFKGTKTVAYSDFTKDVEIIRGKGLIKLEDYAAFLSTQQTGAGNNSSPTHTIGVINTFTDTPDSAAALVLAAKKKNLHVDVWELSNEPVYFDKFYPSAQAYLQSVAPFAAAIKKADPTARVAVYLEKQDKWLDGMAGYKNRFWDEIYMHAYPTPPKEETDAEKYAFYNGFLATMTNHYIDGTLLPLFGSNMKMEISEFNISALRGGMYAAMFIAEYTMRMSSDPHITQMGMHTLIGRTNELDAAVMATTDHKQEAVDAYHAGKTIDTSHLDFGYYYAPDGLALEIINGVINTSSGLWPTLVAGGDSVATMPVGSATMPGRIPALYAQAYKSGDGKTIDLLITNKSDQPQAAVIGINNQPVKALFSTVSIGKTDPTARNTADAPETIRLHRDTVSNTVTVPPYGVMSVSWKAN